jgi:hypothetical protein
VLNTSIRCDVYRNLNKPGIVYSVRQNGIVVERLGSIVLNNVTFKHASLAQQESCKTRRQVCQWVKGFATQERPSGEWVRLSCDPKKTGGFCRADTGERVDSARFVNLCDAGCFAVL